MNAAVRPKRLLPAPLDLDLAALCSSEWQVSLPLGIRRFVEESGVDGPTSAMKRATDSLIAEYAKDQLSPTSPIAVERLCELVGADLIGKRPKGQRSDGHSIQDHRPRLGHTGKLYFEGQRAKIKIPENLDYGTARVSVAHELGHLLIHRRASGYDKATLRLPSSTQEEALAEYGARLLLIPSYLWSPPLPDANLSEYALKRSSITRVTLHSAVLRLGDPDIETPDVCGAILWRMNPQVSKSEPISGRMTPHWHLCPGAFVPVGRCKARNGSLIAELADSDLPTAGARVEEVRIGTFVGGFRIDAVAWGSIADRTRLVLSVFREL